MAATPSPLKQPLIPKRPPLPIAPGVAGGRPPTPPPRPVYQVPSASDITARKKALGARTWLRVDCHGMSQLLEADKYAIMRRCSIPARDLRILDPLLVYPSTILGRERAIVVNLEHIKAIITADEVLLLNPMDPPVLSYAQELQRRLQPIQGQQGTQDDAVSTQTGASEEDRSGHRRSHSEADLGRLSVQQQSSLSSVRDDRTAPFEFKALEIALEAACSYMSSQSTELELEAFPALDELTSKISSMNLERVRRLKSRLVALTVRVQKMRDEIEQLLDDDEDMAEMYLTAKKEQMLEPDSPTSIYSHAHPQANAFGSAMTLQGPGEDSVRRPPAYADTAGQDLEEDQDVDDSPHQLSRKGSRMSRHSSGSSSSSSQMDVDELEMLLEAYFVQIDGINNKLSALKNYIDDTEDYINLQLDNHRNQLLQLEIILTIATFVMAIFSVVAGVFGMNIPIKLYEEEYSWTFKWILLGTGFGGLAVFTALMAWVKYNNLLS